MRFDEKFLRAVLPDVSLVSANFQEDPQFCVDTRVLKKGDIFIALKGAVVDGHDYCAQALQLGAGGLIIAADQMARLSALKSLTAGKLLIAVENPLQALMSLACAWRAQFTYPVVAITGSVGKTSTKELIAHILSCNGNSFLASHGNQNTKIGISLTMLRMRAHHQMAIVEVGINKRGEMAELSNMLRPTTAVITNIGHTHMEGLGSLHDIALEKRDVFKYFTETSIGIINGDQKVLSQVGYVHPVLKFGTKTTNQIQARKISLAPTHISFTLKIYKEKYPIMIQHVHESVIFNSLAATAVAHLLGVAPATIVDAIQHPPVVAGRFEQKILKAKKGIVIHDCYNANPESMKAALLAFQKIDTGAYKIAVLGDMLELGMNSPFWHRQLGRFLRKVPSLKQVILVGDMMKWTKKTLPVGLSATIVPTWQDAVKELEAYLDKEALVLVKGSRGVGLTHLVTAVSQPS